MVVFAQKPVEVPLNGRYGRRLDPLLDVGAVDSLDHYLGDDPHGPESPDRRPEQIARGLALEYLSFAVY